MSQVDDVKDTTTDMVDDYNAWKGLRHNQQPSSPLRLPSNEDAILCPLRYSETDGNQVSVCDPHATSTILNNFISKWLIPP